MFVWNKMLSQTGGHGDLHMLPAQFNTYGRLCDGAQECRKAAREMFREGADFIKICSSGGVLSEKDDPRSPQFTIEEMEAIVYEAQSFGSYVASHAQSTIGIKNALKAGVKTIEHGTLLDDEAIEMMLNQDAILVPTLAISHLIVTEGHRYGIPAFGLKKAQQYYEVHKENIAKAYQAGVKIAMGSDLMGCKPVEHGKNGMELGLLVDEIGMSPMETIMAATRVSTEAMAMEDAGVIAQGKKADLLVIEGDPTKDIHVLLNPCNIEMVYVGGKQLK
ncbi:metal-dependent hydrolase family protein [Paenibacillus sp. OSY-SE]|uniref:metal-dependent hydrolase family protein n=1 Tax=Paenibacillus sp. OSY-SE TaxID=1196323 RepID=UPI0002F01AFE|nr:amidohydrolase family protein [Paenibacillus sp. OSY-SE]